MNLWTPWPPWIVTFCLDILWCEVQHTSLCYPTGYDAATLVFLVCWAFPVGVVACTYSVKPLQYWYYRERKGTQHIGSYRSATCRTRYNERRRFGPTLRTVGFGIEEPNRMTRSWLFLPSLTTSWLIAFDNGRRKLAWNAFISDCNRSNTVCHILCFVTAWWNLMRQHDIH